MISVSEWTSLVSERKRAEETWTTREVARMTGATYRQLDYWCREGMIDGQRAGAWHGSGKYRQWTRADVDRARVLAFAARLRMAPLDELVDLLVRYGVIEGESRR